MTKKNSSSLALCYFCLILLSCSSSSSNTLAFVLPASPPSSPSIKESNTALLQLPERYGSRYRIGTSSMPGPAGAGATKVWLPPSVAGNPQANLQLADALDTLAPSPIIIQGGALRTWSFATSTCERVVIDMTTVGELGGTPLNANVKLCQGPNNTPLEFDIYGGKGKLRPFKAVIETPGGGSSLFILNKAPMTYPIYAKVGAEMTDPPSTVLTVDKPLYDFSSETLVQGGSIFSYALDSSISKIKVLLKTDGRPLNAQIELIQGPNAPKVTVDLYTEDGLERPFLCVIETPGAENSIRIINTASVEFPMVACVEVYETNV